MRFFALASAFALAAPTTAVTEDRIDTGQIEFAARCASCHGMDGKGGGPLAEWLNIEPTDLTKLSAGNGGKFPYDRVYRTIDGRTQVRAHGSRDMPVWGDAYTKEAASRHSELEGSVSSEIFIAGKILLLMRHLESLQEAE